MKKVNQQKIARESVKNKERHNLLDINVSLKIKYWKAAAGFSDLLISFFTPILISDLTVLMPIGKSLKQNWRILLAGCWSSYIFSSIWKNNTTSDTMNVC